MASAVISRNPASGEVVFTCPSSTPESVAAGVAQAAAGGSRWAATSFAERATILLRFADLLDEQAETMAALITREVGKRTVEAAGEVEWGALSARWYAEHPPLPTRHAGAVVRRQPLGVIAVITPWNVPLITPAWKWLPALMAGNAVVWKPSELATATAAATVDLLQAAGLPEDVLQLVPGGAGTAVALCQDERVAGVHFTGSTRAGREIARLVAPRFARCALEMGGVNAALVFADADLPAAADAIVATATAINGQKCTAVRRVLVDDEVADELLAHLAERIEALVPGDPAEPATTLGPLISAAARDRAERSVVDAAGRGGVAVARTPMTALRSQDPGTFFPATVLTGLPDRDPLETEEVFAPLLAVQRFHDVESAWELAGRSGYGLCAAVYSGDPDIGRVAAERLPVGVLEINRRSDAVDLAAPFGGRGNSGNGFPEGGSFVYNAVTDVQAVYGDDAT